MDTTYALPEIPLSELDIEQEDVEVMKDSLEFNLRYIPGVIVKESREERGFYYRDYFDSLLRAKKIITPARRNTSWQYTITRILSWIGVIGILVFLVYKLIPGGSFFFIRNRKNTERSIEELEEERSESLASMIESAMSKGDYRTATRYLFLQTIKKLSLKGYLEEGKNKTNYQYISELRKQPWVNEFASLSMRYEFIWYGEYPVSGEMFEHIYKSFNLFQNKLGKL